MKRLRAEGKVPAVLYGHGQENINLTLDEKDVSAILKHSGHIVTLTGDLNESALIKDVQWDHVSDSILHIDLNRIDATETVEVSLTIELKGTAKGASQGAIVNQVVHEADILCPANLMPERLELRITDLDVGQSLRLKDVPLPEGASLAGSGDVVVVTCAMPQAEEELEATGGPAEPEVIGRDKSDDEEGDGDDDK